MRVAVLDEDSAFVKGLTVRFEALGWPHRVMSTPVRIDEIRSMKLNAIVIDPESLGDDPWGYLDSLSGLMPELAVLVCSRGSTVAQRVRGLRLGADDWIIKPCHPEEVVARIEAVTRRRRRRELSAEVGPLVTGELEIRPDQYQAYVSGSSVDLTRREFELLRLLADNQGRVLEREAIYERVWGYAMAHGDRSVDVFVRKIRHKLAKRSPDWDYVHTHFGIGYRFDPVSPDQEAGSAGAPVGEPGEAGSGGAPEGETSDATAADSFPPAGTRSART